MSRRWILAAAATVALICPARADLITETFDDVRDAVEDRFDDLEGQNGKTEKKQFKAAKGVLKLFQKQSKNAKKDGATIRKIVTKLEKSFADDEELLGLVHDALEAWQAELTGELSDYHKSELGLTVLDEDNKGLKGAMKAWDKTLEVELEIKETKGLKDRAKLTFKLLVSAQKTWKKVTKALGKQDISAHTQAILFDLETGYLSADTCITCHTDSGTEVMASGHWNWAGEVTNIVGFDGEVHGKKDLLNNFCIAIPSNEGRCTQCHVGSGWSDDTFDFADTAAIDCLVCHDGSGLYKKGKTIAGAPDPSVDLQRVALHVGEPNRQNCGACHFFAGGGDNVKHGDLASVLTMPTRDMDVHMGTDGGDMSCQSCHVSMGHEFAGMPLHSTSVGPVECTSCHDQAGLEGLSHSANHLANVACQTCHIPSFSRQMPTKVDWRWADAGQDIDPIPLDKYGKPTYDKKKGTFIWDQDVEPVLRWSNGMWERIIIGENDTYDDLPVVFADPVGEKDDGESKITPFKLMTGNQPADAINKTVLVPHLFGMKGGEFPYWVQYDWVLALTDGAAAAGQTFSGTHEFVDTEMYLSVNHEIAPKEMARDCNDCHNGGIDFTALGYTDDPVLGGT